MIHTPVVTKLCINGSASDDSDEWTEEVKAHNEKCLMIRLRRQRSRPRGSVTKEVVVTAWSLFKGGRFIFRWTGSFVYEGR